MGYTLWRNNTMLGEIVVEYPTATPNFVGGMFVPTPAFTEPGLIQGYLPFPTRRLFQASFAPSSARGHTSPLVPSASPEVPLERVLEVRDDHGNGIPTESIVLHETSDLAAEPGSQLFKACADKGIAFSPWLLAVQFAPGGNAA
jgi:hypothetical protein